MSANCYINCCNSSCISGDRGSALSGLPEDSKSTEPRNETFVAPSVVVFWPPICGRRRGWGAEGFGTPPYDSGAGARDEIERLCTDVASNGEGAWSLLVVDKGEGARDEREPL